MELVSYAMDFASFLMQNLKETEKIKSIILFGSVARGEADKQSDVDVFVDVLGREKKIGKQIEKIKDRFFNSVKFKKYWELLNVKNDINIIVGKLDKWKLKDSMLGNAIILYQKYAPRLEEGKNMIILSWGAIKKNSKRVMLNKNLFGYNYYGGRKLGGNVIEVPAEHLNLFVKLFHKFKVAVKIMRVFEYE